MGAGAGFLGATTGAIITLFIRTESKGVLSALMSFAAGVMIAVVCFDLVPEATGYGNIYLTVGSILLGVAAVSLIEQISIRKKVITSLPTEHNNEKLISIGLIISFALGLHNLPEGIIIGTSTHVERGAIMAILIGLHDIPEGMAMAAPLRAAGKRPLYLIGICALSGVPTFVGAALGYVLGSISPVVMAICTAAAGGAMIYVVFAQMLPASGKLYGGRLSGFATILGILVGIFIISML